MRIGLTGGLGSGKSTVAAMLAGYGAHIISADDLGRQLMQPGEQVFDAVLAKFGPGLLGPNGALDRAKLAGIAFQGGRVDELNAIVHPAAIALQGHLTDEILQQNPEAIVIVESALIFETKYGGKWRERFDRMVLICAPEKLKIARFVARTPGGDQVALEAEARRRLAQMIPDGDKVQRVDYVLRNDSTLDHLRSQVERLWDWLK